MISLLSYIDLPWETSSRNINFLFGSGGPWRTLAISKEGKLRLYVENKCKKRKGNKTKFRWKFWTRRLGPAARKQQNWDKKPQVDLEKEKISVGQIGRERSHPKLSVNTYFDIFFHDGIIFFSCFLLMTPIWLQEADLLQRWWTAALPWWWLLLEEPLPACHSRWTMHNLNFLLLPFFTCNTYIGPNCDNSFFLWDAENFVGLPSNQTQHL